MSNHFQLLKYAVETPLPQLRKEMAEQSSTPKQRRGSLFKKDIVIGDGRITNITEEVFTDKKTGKAGALYRVNVASSEGGEYNRLGWIHLAEVANCMLCGNSFGTMRPKNSCYGCGHVVCATCSPNKGNLAEIQTEKKVRICRSCYTGKDPINVFPPVAAPPATIAAERVKPSLEPIGGEDSSSVVSAQISPVGGSSPATPGFGGETDELADAALQHLSMLKFMTNKPLRDIMQAYRNSQQDKALMRRKSMTSPRSVNDAYFVTDVKEETVFLDQEKTKESKVFRMYLASSTAGEYCCVGWIALETVTNCMCCCSAFSATLGKAHCKACGNAVCGKCLNNEAILSDLKAAGKQRVCLNCFTGDEVVEIKSTLVEDRAMKITMSADGSAPKAERISLKKAVSIVSMIAAEAKERPELEAKAAAEPNPETALPDTEEAATSAATVVSSKEDVIAEVKETEVEVPVSFVKGIFETVAEDPSTSLNAAAENESEPSPPAKKEFAASEPVQAMEPLAADPEPLLTAADSETVENNETVVATADFAESVVGEVLSEISSPKAETKMAVPHSILAVDEENKSEVVKETTPETKATVVKKIEVLDLSNEKNEVASPIIDNTSAVAIDEEQARKLALRPKLVELVKTIQPEYASKIADFFMQLDLESLITLMAQQRQKLMITIYEAVTEIKKNEKEGGTASVDRLKRVNSILKRSHHGAPASLAKSATVEKSFDVYSEFAATVPDPLPKLDEEPEEDEEVFISQVAEGGANALEVSMIDEAIDEVVAETAAEEAIADADITVEEAEGVDDDEDDLVDHELRDFVEEVSDMEDENQRKQMLRVKLYGMVDAVQPTYAHKITEVLMQLQSRILLKLLLEKQTFFLVVYDALSEIMHAEEQDDENIIHINKLQRLPAILMKLFPDEPELFDGDDSTQEDQEAVMLAEQNKRKKFEEDILMMESEVDQKTLIHERLFAIIESMQPGYAQTIADLLITLDVRALLGLLKHKQSLMIVIFDALSQLMHAEESGDANIELKLDDLPRLQEVLLKILPPEVKEEVVLTFDEEVLALESEEEQRAMIKDKMLPIIAEVHPKFPRRIAAVFLQLHVRVLLVLLKNPSSLKTLAFDALSEIMTKEASGDKTPLQVSQLARLQSVLDKIVPPNLIPKSLEEKVYEFEDVADQKAIVRSEIYTVINDSLPKYSDRITDILMQLEVKVLLLLLKRKRQLLTLAYDALSEIVDSQEIEGTDEDEKFISVEKLARLPIVIANITPKVVVAPPPKTFEEEVLEIKKVDKQKKRIGSKLHLIVEEVQPKFANRITEILLQLDVQTLLFLLQDQNKPSLLALIFDALSEIINADGTGNKAPIRVESLSRLQTVLQKVFSKSVPKTFEEEVAAAKTDEDKKAIIRVKLEVAVGKIQQTNASRISDVLLQLEIKHLMLLLLEENRSSLKTLVFDTFSEILDADEAEDQNLVAIDKLARLPGILAKITPVEVVPPPPKTFEEEVLEIANEADQKFLIRGQLLSMVQEHQPSYADKITEVLLQLDVHSLLLLLKHRQSLLTLIFDASSEVVNAEAAGENPMVGLEHLSRLQNVLYKIEMKSIPKTFEETILAMKSEDEQKEAIFTKLVSIVEKAQPAYATNVAKVLIELEVPILLLLIQNKPSLMTLVFDAISAILDSEDGVVHVHSLPKVKTVIEEVTPKPVEPPKVLTFEEEVRATDSVLSQKDLIRTRLLEIIATAQPVYAEPITDIFLQLDVDVLLTLIDNEQSLMILVYDALSEVVHAQETGINTISLTVDRLTRLPNVLYKIEQKKIPKPFEEIVRSLPTIAEQKALIKTKLLPIVTEAQPAYAEPITNVLLQLEVDNLLLLLVNKPYLLTLSFDALSELLNGEEGETVSVQQLSRLDTVLKAITPVVVPPPRILTFEEQLTLCETVIAQKTLIRTRVFPIVEKAQPNYADKITAVLMMLPVDTLLILLENEQSLMTLIFDALSEVVHAEEAGDGSMVMPDKLTRLRAVLQKIEQKKIPKPIEELLAALPTEEQKKAFLRSRVIGCIQEVQPAYADPITDVLMQLDNKILIILLNNKPSLLALAFDALSEILDAQENEDSRAVNVHQLSRLDAVLAKIVPVEVKPKTFEEEVTELTFHIDQKNLIRTRLFPIIQEAQPSFAEKICDVLLQIDIPSLLILLQHQKQLLILAFDALSEIIHAEEVGDNYLLPIERLKRLPTMLQKIAAKNAPKTHAAILKELESEENQREYLRSKIFAIAAEVQESEAAIVTQIIMQLDTRTLLGLLENKPSLMSLIFDALSELVSYEGAEAGMELSVQSLPLLPSVLKKILPEEKEPVKPRSFEEEVLQLDNDTDQKQLIRMKIFYVVDEYQPEFSNKITDVLLQLPVVTLLQLLQHKQQLLILAYDALSEIMHAEKYYHESMVDIERLSHLQSVLEKITPVEVPEESLEQGQASGTDDIVVRTFDEEVLALDDEQDQKVMIREKLVAVVEEYQPALAPKITEVLIQLEVEVLLILLKNKPSLRIVIYDALSQIMQAEQADDDSLIDAGNLPRLQGVLNKLPEWRALFQERNNEGGDPNPETESSRVEGFDYDAVTRPTSSHSQKASPRALKSVSVAMSTFGQGGHSPRTALGHRHSPHSKSNSNADLAPTTNVAAVAFLSVDDKADEGKHHVVFSEDENYEENPVDEEAEDNVYDEAEEEGEEEEEPEEEAAEVPPMFGVYGRSSSTIVSNDAEGSKALEFLHVHHEHEVAERKAIQHEQEERERLEAEAAAAALAAEEKAAAEAIATEEERAAQALEELAAAILAADQEEAAAGSHAANPAEETATSTDVPATEGDHEEPEVFVSFDQTTQNDQCAAPKCIIS